MQRNPIELGAFHHEFIGGEHVPKKAVAQNSAGGGGDSAGNLAQWTAHCFHRATLRALRSGDDPQHFSQARWAAVFCPFPDSVVFPALVAAQGRGPRGITG